MHPYFDPAGLRPGDVLLMKGCGAVSDLIAWFGDSTYSHAAVMVDGGCFVEAALPSARVVALTDRLAQVDEYDFIDACRPCRADGTPLREADRAALVAAARGLVGVSYPLDALLQMAVFAALRNRIPAHAGLRGLLRTMIDHALRFDPQHMVCSELVYCAFREAGLAPALITSAQLDLPLPAVDPAALLEEWRAARGRAGAAAEAAHPAKAEASEEELEDLLHRFRARRGSYPRLLQAQPGTSGLVPVPVPNPADVLPVDLETSPQLRRLGRLPMAR